MVRAAAKNHAWVGIVTEPGAVRRRARRAARERRRSSADDDPPRARARGVRAHRRLRRRHRRAGSQGDEPLPRHLVLALDRTDESCATARTRTSRPPATGVPARRSWWDGVTQHSGLALSYLNFYDTEAAWRLVHDLGDGPACAIIKHANPCGVAVAADSRDRLPARARVRRAVGVRRDRGAQPPDRRRDGRADGRRPAGRRRSSPPATSRARSTRSSTKRKNTRLLEAPPPEPRAARLPPDLRRVPRPGARRTSRRAATTGGSSPSVAPTDEQWPDAELAWRVCGHVKSNCDRAREGRPGRRHRRRPAEPGRRGRDRGEEGRRAGPRAARAPPTASIPFPDGIEAAAAAGVAVVVQPGGAVRDEEVIARADELGLAMVFTGERHFLH